MQKFNGLLFFLTVENNTLKCTHQKTSSKSNFYRYPPCTTFSISGYLWPLWKSNSFLPIPVYMSLNNKPYHATSNYSNTYLPHCLTHSNKHTLVACDTFMDFTGPNMGIWTSICPGKCISSGIPDFSLPTTRAIFSGN